MTKLISRAAILAVTAALALVTCGDKGTGNGGGDDIDQYGRTMYTLTTGATPDEGGYVSRSPDTAKYPSGTEVTVTATAEEGYAFAGWSGASTETTPSIVITMSGHLTLIANFELVTEGNYTLTVDRNPASGGTVSRNPDQTDYAPGTNITVTASPAEGYEFIGWSGTATSTEPEVSIAITSNMTLTANFQLIDGGQYTLTIERNPAAGGTVSREPEQPTYRHGTAVTVRAAPADGYAFIGWTGTVTTTTDPEVTVSMNSNMTITANFESIAPDHYTLTVERNPASGGTVSRSPNLTDYAAGTVVNVTAEPTPGYRFIGWSGASTSTELEIPITMNNNQRLIANFEIVTYTLTISLEPDVNATVFINNAASNAVTTHNAETLVNVRAEAPGYTFTGWTGASTSTNATVTVTMNGNKELTANFRINTYTLTANASPAEGGSVERNPSRDNYDHGTQVTLTAIPAAGYALAGWIGATGIGTQTAVTMDGNKTLTAVFEPIPVSHYTLDVGVDPAVGGNVSRNPDAASYAGGTDVTVTAEAKEGYSFVNWTGALSSTNQSVTVTMNNNATLTANFKVNTYALTNSLTPAGGGIVHVNGVESTVPTTHTHGTTVNISATASPGYRFVNWEATSGTAIFANANNSNTTVSINSDAAIRANFVLLVSLTVNSAAGGTVTPVSLSNIDAGAPVNISATANAGYRFAGWEVTSGTAVFANENSAATTVTLSSNATIQAKFQIERYTLEINRNPIAGGSITPESGLYHDTGTVVNISAVVNSGYRFVNWTVVSGTATFGNATSASTTVRMSSNAVIQANFLRRFTLTVNRNITAGGTVNPSSATLDSGAVFNITATAASTTANCYRFANWTVTDGTAVFGNANSASTTVSLSSDAVISANFEQAYTLTVNRNVTAGGTVTPTNTQCHNTGIADITATPAKGYEFDSWTVTSGTATFANVNSTSTTVALGSNATISANFKQVSGTFTDTRDGTAYRYVGIGNQIWMAENLNYGGDDNNVGSCYNSAPDSCAKYGRVYRWSTVMNGAASSTSSPSGVQGICPAGWHVPSRAEWTTLVNFVGSSTAGIKLKSSPPAWNGTDDFGFSALPGSSSTAFGIRGGWWSATVYSTSRTYIRRMYTDNDGIEESDVDNTLYYSVRCLRD